MVTIGLSNKYYAACLHLIIFYFNGVMTNHFAARTILNVISDFSSTQAWFSPATNTRTATHFSREKGLDTIISTLVSEFFLLAVLGLVDVRFRLAYLTYGRVCAYA